MSDRVAITAHFTVANQLIDRMFPVSDLATSYSLTGDDQEAIQRHLRSIAHTRSEIVKVLDRSYKRKEKTYFTYSHDINEPEGDEKYYSFIGNLAYDDRDIFYDCDDNHGVTELLESQGVLGEDDILDPEMCCSYFYFRTKEAARSFIDRLNAFVTKRRTEK